MLALGEPSYEPFVYQPLLIQTRHALLNRNYPSSTCSAADAEEDSIGGPRASCIHLSR
jgi:hypothetical protein